MSVGMSYMSDNSSHKELPLKEGAVRGRGVLRRVQP